MTVTGIASGSGAGSTGATTSTGSATSSSKGSAAVVARVVRAPFPPSPFGVRERLPLDRFRVVTLFSREPRAPYQTAHARATSQPGRRTASPTTARRRGS
jgi:hypothetical protein